jgi:hypothetical protein
MGELLSKNELSGLTEIAGENWFSDLQTMATSAAAWYAREGIENSTIIDDENKERVN